MDLRRQKLLAVFFGIAILGSCGFGGLQNGAEEVADNFYESQKSDETTLSGDFFNSDQVRMEAENQISRRKNTYGGCVSHNRIGSSRHVEIEGRERKESITYIFEVNCENGKTRETLRIIRSGAAEPWLIAAYVIESIPRMDGVPPDGTSST
jgi:hypothetical protein